MAGTGKIAASSTRCTDFSSGNFAPLNTIGYGLNRGSIKTVSPVGFAYFSKVTGPFVSGDVITISQTDNSINQTPLFAAQDPVSLYSAADCSSSTASATIVTGDQVTINFTAPFSGNPIIVVKYSTKAVVGAPQPSPATVHYSFVTALNTSVVDHNTNGLDLAPR